MLPVVEKQLCSNLYFRPDFFLISLFSILVAVWQGCGRFSVMDCFNRISWDWLAELLNKKPGKFLALSITPSPSSNLQELDMKDTTI